MRLSSNQKEKLKAILRLELIGRKFIVRFIWIDSRATSGAGIDIIEREKGFKN